MPAVGGDPEPKLGWERWPALVAFAVGPGAGRAALAQSAERLTRNEKVVGSIPTGGSIERGYIEQALLTSVAGVSEPIVLVTKGAICRRVPCAGASSPR